MKKSNKFPKTENEPLEKKEGYPEKEAIDNKFDKEFDIDPDNSAKEKQFVIIDNKPTWNKRSFEQDTSGNDLVIPGFKRDAVHENIGNKAEKSTGYSVDGENNTNLEEDN